MDKEIDLAALHLQPVGSYPGVEEKAALQLARAIHRAEATGVATSWSAQQRAQEYANAHTLSETLDEIARLEGVALEHARATQEVCPTCDEHHPAGCPAECSHVADAATVQPASGAAGIVDVACAKCGALGSFLLDVGAVNW